MCQADEVLLRKLHDNAWVTESFGSKWIEYGPSQKYYLSQLGL